MDAVHRLNGDGHFREEKEKETLNSIIWGLPELLVGDILACEGRRSPELR